LCADNVLLLPGDSLQHAAGDTYVASVSKQTIKVRFGGGSFLLC
jgi:hypothetical protein